MSTNGIHRFQGWLTNAESIRALVETSVEIMLRHGRTFNPYDYPESRKFLLEVARVLAKSDLAVSDDLVTVKVRQIAPEQANTEWATDSLVSGVCERVASALSDVEAFAIYTEIGMDEPNLDLDVSQAWKATLPEAARQLCELFAYRVFMAVADDDLIPSPW